MSATEIPAPSNIATAFRHLRAEVTSLQHANRSLKFHNDKLRDHRDRLERRLTGALYELYGDWERVNRELPRA